MGKSEKTKESSDGATQAPPAEEHSEGGDVIMDDGDASEGETLASPPGVDLSANPDVEFDRTTRETDQVGQYEQYQQYAERLTTEANFIITNAMPAPILDKRAGAELQRVA